MTFQRDNEHSQMVELLFPYLDGYLDEGQRLQVERHVAACASCAHELEVSRRANDVFSKVPQVPLPTGFYERMQLRLAAEAAATPRNGHAAISPRPAAARPKSTRWRTFLAIAACFVIALGTLFLFPPAPPPQEEAQSPATLAYGDGEILVAHHLSTPSRAAQTVALRAGDTVQTGTDAHAVIALGAGSSMRLAPNTTVKLVALSGDSTVFAKVELDQGRLWVEEANGARCSVQTEDVLLIPIGTTYEAVVEDGESRVHVYEGTVDLTSNLPSQARAQLQGGHGAHVSVRRQTARLSLLDANLETDPWVQWNRRVAFHPRRRLRAPLVPATFREAPATVPRWASAPPPSPRWLRAPLMEPSTQPALRPVRYRPSPGITPARPGPAAVRPTTSIPPRQVPPATTVTRPAGERDRDQEWHTQRQERLRQWRARQERQRRQRQQAERRRQYRRRHPYASGRQVF